MLAHIFTNLNIFVANHADVSLNCYIEYQGGTL